ncbi:hypothetical protein TCAL_17441 [Tigriopus californicus]|uniref:Invertebrate defensins family profile domain-containing protein n=1 Tax=Tigriopus californicus TaxID=6832 RepID=A0A553PT12_TIGCA|nr:uncharacterized protein LOC131891365 [Tigriopus californicus]TRY80827.1 hypothetical protein TCAL_17441 [Tigriopus californicus]|eukprot:TCALIF_13768-PA protein Name:"Protein of unknown function" AED:0.00 eAED:0.00 QI:26/1/1/1/1/1/2/62/115
MKSFFIPVLIALLGFSLLTLADFGANRENNEESQGLSGLENGVIVSVEAKISESNEVEEDQEEQDEGGSQNRAIDPASCAVKCQPVCVSAPAGSNCTCTQFFLGFFPISSITIPC